MNRYKSEIIWWSIYILILLAGLILPEGDFLEILYRFHKKIIYSLTLFFILWNIFRIIQDFIKNKKPLHSVIKHILTDLLILFLLFSVNLWVYEKIVGSKLTTIKISTLEIIGSIVQVKIFVRNVKWPIYLIVETPQGTKWIQCKKYIPYGQFKTYFIEEVRLGEGDIGMGKNFKILAISTKEKLRIGVLREIPPGSIVSNILIVKRVR